MLEIIYLSFVTASISFTVAETKLFEPLRKFFDKHISLIGKLFNCGYCFGHWIAFILVAIYRPRLFQSSFLLIDYFFTALVITWLAGFQWILLCYLMKSITK